MCLFVFMRLKVTFLFYLAAKALPHPDWSCCTTLTRCISTSTRVSPLWFLAEETFLQTVSVQPLVISLLLQISSCVYNTQTKCRIIFYYLKLGCRLGWYGHYTDFSGQRIPPVHPSCLSCTGRWEMCSAAFVAILPVAVSTLGNITSALFWQLRSSHFWHFKYIVLLLFFFFYLYMATSIYRLLFIWNSPLPDVLNPITQVKERNPKNGMLPKQHLTKWYYESLRIKTVTVILPGKTASHGEFW